MSLGRVFNLDIVSLKMLSCGIIIDAFFQEPQVNIKAINNIFIL